MNERIKELWRQSVLNNTTSPMNFQAAADEFAQLIVQECCTVMNTTAKIARDNCTYMGDDVPTFVHQTEIKKHFGVD